MVGLAGFSAFLPLYATQSLLPLFIRVFDASKADVSLTVSATTAAIALSAPFTGVLANWLGRKRVIVVAVLGVSLLTLLAATAPDLASLIRWRFCQGLLMPAIFAVTLTYIGEEWAREQVATTISVYVTGNILGGILGRCLAGLVAAAWGWRWVFVVLASLNLLCGMILWRGLPRSQHFLRHEESFAQTLQQPLRTPQQLWRQLNNAQLWLSSLVGFNVLFSMVATFTYINFYLAAKPFRLSSAALGAIFWVYLLGVVVMPLVGRGVARLGYPKTLAFALESASLGVLLTLSGNLGVVILGLALCAAGIFVSQSVANSYVSKMNSQAGATAFGLYLGCYYAGGSLGAVLPSLIWPVGGWPLCVCLIVLVQLLTAGIALCFWRN
jgi:MFS transporter, YNFM family, putative membrane transport protein